MAKDRRRYTEAEKREAILLYKANNFNLQRTAKQIDVQRCSLRNWVESDFGVKVLNSTPAVGLIKVCDTVLKNKQEVIDEAGSALIETIKRGVELAKSEKDIDKITRFIQGVATVFDNEADGKGSNKDNNTKSKPTLMQQLNIMLKKDE